MRNILKEQGFDDLIFEFRNKDYGAYQLRKRYPRVVIAGIIVSSLLFTLIVIFPFIISKDKGHVVRGGGSYVYVEMENLEPPEEQIFVPPPPPKITTPDLQNIVKYVAPEIVDTLIPIKPLPSTDEILAMKPGEETGVEGIGMEEGMTGGEFGPMTDEPFTLVEIMPSFRGGDLNKFREWVQRRIRYPQEALDKRIKGRVFITFIVDTDGVVKDVTVVKSLYQAIDNVVVNTIGSSPRWTPGFQRGKAVPVRYSIWFSFVF